MVIVFRRKRTLALTPTCEVIAGRFERRFVDADIHAQIALTDTGIRQGEVRVIMFRGFLVLFLVVLTGYTAAVISNHGWNLLAVFFGDLSAITWPGQFNLDFMGFLALSAVWTAWRHQFSLLGLLLGLAAFFGGMMFLTIYLLVASYQVKGDVNALLLGSKRAIA